MSNPITVPTKTSLMGAMGNVAKGALGGGLLAVLMSVLGGWGVILAPVLTGAFMKGETGKIVTTVAGFIAGIALLSGTLGGSKNSGTGGI